MVIDLPHPDKKKNLPSQRSQREPRTKDGGGACGRESPAMTREGVIRKEGNPCSSWTSPWRSQSRSRLLTIHPRARNKPGKYVGGGFFSVRGNPRARPRLRMMLFMMKRSWRRKPSWKVHNILWVFNYCLKWLPIYKLCLGKYKYPYIGICLVKSWAWLW